MIPLLKCFKFTCLDITSFEFESNLKIINNLFDLFANDQRCTNIEISLKNTLILQIIITLVFLDETFYYYQRIVRMLGPELMVFFSLINDLDTPWMLLC